MKISLFVLLLFISILVFAQKNPKKTLTTNDLTNWNAIVNSQISTNGKIVSYELNPLKGDGKLIFIRNNKADTISRGNGTMIGPENNFLIFKIKQPEEKLRKAKKDKVAKEKMPKDSLGILVFGNDSILKFPNLVSFKIPEENSKWITFLTEPGESKKDTTKTKKGVNEKKPVKQPGNNLVFFNSGTSDTLIFQNVTDYIWAKKGSSVCFVQERKDSVFTTSTFHYFDTNTGVAKPVFSSQGWIKNICSSEMGDKFAFLFSTDTIKEKVYTLYYTTRDSKPGKIVDAKTQGIPVGWSPNENGNMNFSEDGSKLYFGMNETPKPEPKDTLLDEDKPSLDIWNWKDSKLQPQQKVELEREQKRTYQAVYHIDANRFIQLADVNIKAISTIQKGNGDIGLGYDDSPYTRAASWTGGANRDYYLIDFKTGIKREMLKNKSSGQLSPAGKFIIWYEQSDSSWYARSTDVENLEIKSLTKIIPVNFYDEENDIPDDPRPYGIAGWSEDDKFVYIYDRYDIWKLDPTGEKVPVCISKAFGRRNYTQLRYVKTNNDLEFIPSNETIILSAMDERTVSEGFFSTKFNAIKDPDILIMDNYSFGNLIKSKKSNEIIWTKQSVTLFPDLWSSDISFKHPKKITDANPQQNDYIWPVVEAVEWNTFAGETMKGLLYKPDNMDPQKKYPMIVYFYEKSYDTKNKYQSPSPSSSTVNKTYYTSNGYLVFVPDITYKTGYPGQSAYNSIVSGTQFLINKYSFVDKDKIGLQGQSWGGYQTAYLITQTDMYAAAMAGAPVSNMTSAYGGIRWESGMSRMFQYEHTQSRIGGTLWEKPLQYIENSPLFYVPKIKTPLLIMHNDADGAVPWYQGIELFAAMRRLDKPAWMLTYNGEPHNLKPTSIANRLDLTVRMFQFFEHYLKDKPMPVWMEKGIKATEKGKVTGY